MNSQEAAALAFLMTQIENVEYLAMKIRRDMDAAIDGTNTRNLIQGLIQRASRHEEDSPVALPVQCDDFPETGNWWHIRTGESAVAAAGSHELAKWLVSLINGGNDAALDHLRAFTSTISACGGIRVDERGRPVELVASSADWPDLAHAYEKACELLGEQPVIEPADATYSDEDDEDAIVTIRCDACHVYTDVTVPTSSLDQWRVNGAVFEYEHACAVNPQPDAQAEEMVLMLWQCAWCKHWFLNDGMGCPDSEGCGGTNCHRCLKEHKGVCGECKKPTLGCGFDSEDGSDAHEVAHV